MDKETLADLMHRLHSGTATQEEKDRLEAWWQEAEEDESYLNSLPEAEREILRLTMLGNIRERIRMQRSEEVAPAQVNGKTRVLRPAYWQVAAAVLLCLAAGIFFYQYTQQESWVTQSAAYGQRRQIVLPDSSVVVLNGNSSIRYASRWPEGGTREVWLDGEGFFSVIHTQNHRKFKVHTPGAVDVEVLGTEFNVRYRRGTARVVLQTGKVKVNRESQAYTMRPGEMLTAPAGTAGFQAAMVDPAVDLSWKGKMLVFREATLESVAAELEDSYGTRIRFRDAGLGQEIFNGSIPADSVEVFFRKVEKLYSAKVTRQNGVYLIER
jgi:ferric-dicitrate binding protein FerR (iron transport regulator)